VSRLARAGILAGEMPAEVVEAIRDALRRLDVPWLAVRSSATIEDTPVSSRAGLFDSYLGVRGDDHAVERVRWAWASLWNARALAALGAAGVSPLRVSLAVLVQELVPTRAAGVLLSRDPSGRADTLVVNANWGLGESISQGDVPGDVFWVRRTTGELLAYDPGGGHVRVDADPHGPGTIESRVPDSDAGRPCLGPEDLARLADVARALEDGTGRSQDVEFGFATDGTLYVFQTRRIVPGPTA
jgi:pyruvate,water dikinase